MIDNSYSFKCEHIIDGSHFFAALRQSEQQVLPESNPYLCSEQFLEETCYVAQQLPVELKVRVKQFTRVGNESGYLLIKALRVHDKLPLTPRDVTDIVNMKAFYGEFWLAMIAQSMGEPFSYVQEGHGYLFHQVVPTQKNHDKLSSQSSSILLDLHTETAFHPFVIDYLLLFCNRNDRDHEAYTIVSSVRKFIKLLDNNTIQQLRRHAYKTGIDYSFGNHAEMRGNGPTLACLYGDDDDPLLIYDRDLMIGIDEPAQNALAELNRAINDSLEKIYLEPGDLLILDNRRAVHGRTQFKAYYDGYDRWLQRAYVAKDLTPAEILFSKRERIITYQF